MTTNPIPNDRTLFARWLLLVAAAVILMFFAALWLFSLLPGVDGAALYAPILSAWGNVGQLLLLIVGIAIVGVMVYAIAPAVRTYYHPDRQQERQLHAAAIAERNTALTERDEAARLAADAEKRMIAAKEQAERLSGAIVTEYTTLYGTANVPGVTLIGMLAAMRSEILITRPRVEKVDAIVRERDDLRTQLADLLNQPSPPVVTWSQLLPLVEHVAVNGVKVGSLRDELRKVAPIPEGEYHAFSAAVRALPCYSPTKRGAKALEVLTVAGAVSPSDTIPHGRNTTLTDGRTFSRTQRTARTKLPTAKARGKVGVEA